MDNANKINENIDKIDSMAKMKLDGYKMSYPKLNKKLRDKNENTYNVLLYVMIAKEINKGFYPKRIGKATDKGTGIRFEKIKTTKEVLDKMQEIEDFTKNLKPLTEEDFLEIKKVLGI